MVTIIICVAIGIFIGCRLAWSNSYSFWDDLLDCLWLSLIFGIVGGFVGLIIAIILPMQTYDKHYSLPIATMQDNNSTSGHFFLGSGQIEGKMNYVFYYEENGLYKLEQVDYKLAQIKYTDSIPKANVTEIYPKECVINNFAYDLDIYSKTYIIEVPKGSIRTDYNLDAQ